MTYDVYGERSRKEVTFVVFDDVIKSPYPVIIQDINEKYHDVYKEVLDLDRLVGYEPLNYQVLSMQRTKKNILEYLSLKPFAWNESLDQLIRREADLYRRSVPLSIGESLIVTTAQRFNKETYVYHPYYDPRIHEDLSLSGIDFAKITLINNPDIVQCIKDIPDKITTFILSDIEDLVDIVNSGIADDSSILLAKYGYNFKETEDDQLDLKYDVYDVMKKRNINFGLFIPKELPIDAFGVG